LDTIIHLAGKAHDTKNTSEAQSYFDINVGLTKTIFTCFLNSGAEKFIYFSSVKAVTDAVGDEVLTEDTVCNPQTPYGKSKLEAEEYIEERRDEGTTARLHDGTTARLHEGTTARQHDCMREQNRKAVTFKPLKKYTSCSLV